METHKNIVFIFNEREKQNTAEYASFYLIRNHCQNNQNLFCYV